MYMIPFECTINILSAYTHPGGSGTLMVSPSLPLAYLCIGWPCIIMALTHLTHQQVHSMAHMYMNALSPCRPASRLGHSIPDLLNWDPSPFVCYAHISEGLPFHSHTFLIFVFSHVLYPSSVHTLHVCSHLSHTCVHTICHPCHPSRAVLYCITPVLEGYVMLPPCTQMMMSLNICSMAFHNLWHPCFHLLLFTSIHPFCLCLS